MNCPRCGGENQCALATLASDQQTPSEQACRGDVSCWCFQVAITPEQRARLPQSASCYCQACLDALVREL